MEFGSFESPGKTKQVSGDNQEYLSSTMPCHMQLWSEAFIVEWLTKREHTLAVIIFFFIITWGSAISSTTTNPRLSTSVIFNPNYPSIVPFTLRFLYNGSADGNSPHEAF